MMIAYLGMCQDDPVVLLLDWHGPDVLELVKGMRGLPTRSKDEALLCPVAGGPQRTR